MAETVSTQLRYRARLRAKGMCADCPTPTENYRCGYHAKKQSEFSRRSHLRHRGISTWPLHNRPWVQELLARESFTAAQAGELAGLSGRHAVDRLRESPSLELTVLGKDPSAKHYRTLIYRVQLKKTGQSHD